MSIEPVPQQSPTDDPLIVFVSPEGGRRFNAFGSTTQFKLEGSHTAGQLSLALAVTPPGEGPPPHLHRKDDELFIIVVNSYRSNRMTANPNPISPCAPEELLRHLL